MVSYSTWNNYISNLNHHAHINCYQAWMKDDDDGACEMMQNALVMKRDPSNTDVYIKFLTFYGPALTGTSFWNNNKTTKSIHELLTISDEASTFALSTIVQLGRLKKRLKLVNGM